ncbi:LOW QUALITY PROTEIN: forkhead box protein H1 [Falco naumanni]|uniref:LOW QUALITY PROTEIN: forkhead box protein H1 n=1 Tax=Falco naumanni TaxID=148594 RepID=UPI001ADE54A5|nr:LOW QUALITY PROTEIN: forkhead box protein H1 [Falco naumanni]
MPPVPPVRPRSGPGSGRGSRGRQRYRRHPKPPYSYLALIALVIRAAPGRRLKLAQIIQEIGSLFPFFGGGYQGWKDSIRHNLSSNPCFAKVLKDPAKPKAKGNYWTVDVSRIPPDALKLQNTAVARGGAAAFARDLAPFVLRGCPYPPETSRRGGGTTWESWGPPRQPRGTPPRPVCGGRRPSSTSPPPPSVGSWGPPVVSPVLTLGGGAVLPPLAWGQLPTSYSTAVAPNAVAPPSGPPFLALRWGVLPPSPQVPPGPPLGSEPEGGAQAMPPNKSIFDVWLSHPGDIVHPTLHG